MTDRTALTIGGARQLPSEKTAKDSHGVSVRTDAAPASPLTIELIKEIAMDIGKETAAYIEVMYPEAVTATSSTFLLSLRNHVYNEIIASLKLNDAGTISVHLEARRKFRREWKAQWKKLRAAK